MASTNHHKRLVAVEEKCKEVPPLMPSSGLAQSILAILDGSDDECLYDGRWDMERVNELNAKATALEEGCGEQR